MKHTHTLLLAGILSLSLSSAMAATCTRMGDTTYCDDDHGNTRVVGAYGDTVYMEDSGPAHNRSVTVSQYGDTVNVDGNYGANTDNNTTYGSYGDSAYGYGGDSSTETLEW